MEGSGEQQVPAKKFKNSDGLDVANQINEGGGSMSNNSTIVTTTTSITNKMNTGNNQSGVEVTNLRSKRTTQLPVMRCIGILPSLPIVSHFCDSDDSNSSLEDLAHTILPALPRQRREDNGDDC